MAQRYEQRGKYRTVSANSKNDSRYMEYEFEQVLNSSTFGVYFVLIGSGHNTAQEISKYANKNTWYNKVRKIFEEHELITKQKKEFFLTTSSIFNTNAYVNDFRNELINELETEKKEIDNLFKIGDRTNKACSEMISASEQSTDYNYDKRYRLKRNKRNSLFNKYFELQRLFQDIDIELKTKKREKKGFYMYLYDKEKKELTNEKVYVFYSDLRKKWQLKPINYSILMDMFSSYFIWIKENVIDKGKNNFSINDVIESLICAIGENYNFVDKYYLKNGKSVKFNEYIDIVKKQISKEDVHYSLKKIKQIHNLIINCNKYVDILKVFSILGKNKKSINSDIYKSAKSFLAELFLEINDPGIIKKSTSFNNSYKLNNLI